MINSLAVLICHYRDFSRKCFSNGKAKSFIMGWMTKYFSPIILSHDIFSMAFKLKTLCDPQLFCFFFLKIFKLWPNAIYFNTPIGMIRM
ncbi:hypothetical protein DK37_21575 [Halomonas sp. SUBG004]|nr:hypothetical protein DK37_21575 [Halomonas sp. SUBG004]